MPLNLSVKAVRAWSRCSRAVGWSARYSAGGVAIRSFRVVKARQTSTNTIGCLDFLKKEKKQKNYWKQETENKNVIY